MIEGSRSVLAGVGLARPGGRCSPVIGGVESLLMRL